jgi:hypothetical protein
MIKYHVTYRGPTDSLTITVKSAAQTIRGLKIMAKRKAIFADTRHISVRHASSGYFEAVYAYGEWVSGDTLREMNRLVDVRR